MRACSACCTSAAGVVRLQRQGTGEQRVGGSLAAERVLRLCHLQQRFGPAGQPGMGAGEGGQRLGLPAGGAFGKAEAEPGGVLAGVCRQRRVGELPRSLDGAELAFVGGELEQGGGLAGCCGHQATQGVARGLAAACGTFELGQAQQRRRVIGLLRQHRGERVARVVEPAQRAQVHRAFQPAPIVGGVGIGGLAVPGQCRRPVAAPAGALAQAEQRRAALRRAGQ